MIGPRARPAVALAVLASLASAGAAAQTSPTRFWSASRAADYAEAELDGARVTPEGALEVGVRVTATPLPGADVAWSLLPVENGVLAGTGHEGVIHRVRGGRAASTDSTGAGQVLSLARGADGAIYAGTAPDGRILRFTGDEAETWFETGDAYVWALVASGDHLWAATGPEGKLWRIEGPERGRAVFRVPEGQLTALAAAPDGGVFAGASGAGVVYHHDGERTRALFEAEEKEIRALAWDGEALYAAALTLPPVQVESGGENGARRVTPNRGQQPSSRVYRIVPDRSVTSWWEAPQGWIFALAPRPGGGLWAATGERAGLYRIDDRDRASALHLEAEGDLTALAVDGGTLWMATSGPARVLRVETRAARGTARSAVLDAGAFARWGRLTAEGDLAGARFDTRSGNTASPDTTWDRWRAVSPGEVASSPPARYLQWRARLEPGSRVRSVRVAYAPVNQPPQIERFDVHPVPGEFYRGEISPRQDPVTQVLPDGQRVQFSLTQPPPGPPDVLPRWAAGLRPLTWSASDPNQDALRYALAYRRLGRDEWVALADDLEDVAYTWDTQGLAEGEYELRLTASDRATRGEEGLDDRRIAGPVRVDHTPPALDGVRLEIEGRDLTVRGTARDGGLYVSQVEIAVDDGPWRLALPEDGLWDGPREAFTGTARDLDPGTHTLRVRAVDALGNATVRTQPVRIEP